MSYLSPVIADGISARMDVFAAQMSNFLADEGLDEPFSINLLQLLFDLDH